MNHDPLFTRRRLLQSAAAATFGAASLPRLLAAAPAGAPRRIVVGGHPWVYAATRPKYDITPILGEVFAAMAYAGLDGIELMGDVLRPGDAVERIGALSKKHNLAIIGASFGAAMWDRAQHAAIMKDAEQVIPRLGQLGGRTLGTSVGPVKGGAKAKKTPEQLDAQAELLRRLTALCRDHGITLNLHNHTYEVENGLHDLKGTLARIPDAKLGPDLNWLVRGGVDPVAFIREYGKQIVFVHLRDQKADGTWPEAMGEGVMDYVAIGKALREAGFPGPAVIELAHERGFKPTRPLRESLKMSREYVRRTMGY